MTAENEIGRHIEAAARALLGDPNQRLSKKNDLRFGTSGSFSVNPSTGQWYDHESKEGGGVLALIERQQGLKGSEAVEWLRSIGCAITDNRPQNVQRRPSGGDSRRYDDPPPPSGPEDYGRPVYGDAGNAVPEPNDPAAAALRAGPTRVYAYEDMSGDLVLEVCRYEWLEDGKKKKTFRQRRPPGPKDKPKDVRQGYIWNLKNIELVPYGLPRLSHSIQNGETILICEGEKDVETLWEWGLAATCNPQGSGKWPEEFGKYFQAAKRVILCEDNDEAGRTHVSVVGSALKRQGIDVRVIDFRSMPPKSDVTDWRDAGGTEDEFLDLMSNAKRWTPEVPKSNYGALRWVDMDQPGPEVEWLWDNFLTQHDKSIIGGESQSGKSFLGINLGLHIALGRPFMGHDTAAGLVCYQAGESARGARRRMRAFRDEYDVPADREVPFVLLSKRIDLFSRDSGDVQGLIDEVKGWQAYYIDHPLRWLCIDTLARASVGAEENSAKDMGIVLDNLDKLEQSLGCAVSAVHHMNAVGSKLRGSSAVFANVEQVLVISRDQETNVRTLRVSKMKDDADGGTINFELKVRNLGQDVKGKPITSCVVMPAGWKTGQAVPDAPDPAASRRFKLRSREVEPFLAILRALKDHGEVPPADLAEKYGMPPERRVVRWPHVLTAYEAGTNEHDPEKIQKALSDAGTKLRQYHVIERENPFIWWTGRPVDGFVETYPPRAREKKQDPATERRPDVDDAPIDDFL